MLATGRSRRPGVIPDLVRIILCVMADDALFLPGLALDCPCVTGFWRGKAGAFACFPSAAELAAVLAVLPFDSRSLAGVAPGPARCRQAP